MADLIYLAIIVAFFAVAAGFVVTCDRIIGPDELDATPPVSAPEPGRTREAA